jgi:hypothetical protein
MRGPPDATALAGALAGVGIAADVEVEGTLAVLRPAPGALAPLAAARAEVVAMARAHGFTHAAVELPRDRDAAAHPGP